MQMHTCWAFWDLSENAFLVQKTCFWHISKLSIFSFFVSFVSFFVLKITFWLKFQVIQLHTCSLCILSKKNVNFQYIWLKYQLFTLHKVCGRIWFSFWLLLNLSFRFFLIHMHSALSQEAVFLWCFSSSSSSSSSLFSIKITKISYQNNKQCHLKTKDGEVQHRQKTLLALPPPLNEIHKGYKNNYNAYRQVSKRK